MAQHNRVDDARDDLLARDAAHLIHPMHSRRLQDEAVVWTAGRGAILVDQNGREYLDGLSGLWNVLVGHGRAELAEVAARQMRELSFASTFAGSTHPKAIELAERLAEICYPSIQRFFFTTSGSEAVEAAIKTARFYWKRQARPEKTKVICLTQAYHGTTLAAMSATGAPQYCDMFEPRTPGFVHIDSSYPYRFQSPAQVSADDRRTPGQIAADLLDEAVLREGADTVAAFLAEPVQAAGGDIVPPDDYWPRIRQICNHHNLLLVADEVVTAFGRTGRWFALEHWGIEPDVVAFAKGMTSGYFPLGGIGVNAEITAAIDSGEGPTRWNHACTSSGHPVGCAVALANLDIIEREGLLERARILGQRLLTGLGSLLTHPQVGDVRGLGLLAGVELVADKATKAAFPAEAEIGRRLYLAALDCGLFSRTRGDIFHLAPPLVSTDEQIDRLVETLAEAIAAVFRSF